METDARKPRRAVALAAGAAAVLVLRVLPTARGLPGSERGSAGPSERPSGPALRVALSVQRSDKVLRWTGSVGADGRVRGEGFTTVIEGLPVNFASS